MFRALSDPNRGGSFISRLFIVLFLKMSSNSIDKKTLEYLANLSRIKLEKKEEERFLKDLWEILNYFELLKEVDTENIEPLSGGTITENVFREFEKEEKEEKEKLKEQFFEKKDNYLKIPPVFE